MDNSAIPNNKLAFALTLIVLLATVLLYWHYVTGVRGSDQYWYLSDTETLVSGSSPHTNTVFSGMLLRQTIPNPETFFVHNGPLLHLNAAIGRVTGAFHAWKITNLAFFLIAALFTGFLVKQLCDTRYACLAVSLYLLTPIHNWLAGNLLQETFYSAITAVLSFLIVVRFNDSRWGWLLPPVLFIGTLAHPMYPLLGVIICGYLLFERNSYGQLITCLVAIVAAIMLLVSLNH